MDAEIKKNVPLAASIHATLVDCAKSRGMTIQGLTERIVKSWIDQNFFNSQVASSNRKGRRSNA